ncbi:MAG: transcription factor FapR [Peptoclostridium sp.]|uniref:transcription factor FapR n=1 Tax=Peptoclostridium sp. TaxID=1904860 RepID=UPI00139D6C90|nr:transcription factor FapR [Peptoclostridium sp.]MZQ75993.1 transcription factor FapR [Peptoclostridium sp.]
MRKKRKSERQSELIDMLKEDPFYTDEELSEYFNVSIQTVRLDRLTLGIPEYRERVKKIAESNVEKVTTLIGGEIVGELVNLEIGSIGISILETTDDMIYSKSGIVKGHYIFGQAESLAMAVIDAPAVLLGVANIKTITPIKSGEKLVAKAEVARKRGRKHYVHVKINNQAQEQVFRGKFIFDELADKEA